MKYLFYGLLPFALSVHAQQSTNSQFILRSTLGMSSVHSDQPPQHILQQSTGTYYIKVEGEEENGSFQLSVTSP